MEFILGFILGGVISAVLLIFMMAASYNDDEMDKMIDDLKSMNGIEKEDNNDKD